MAKRRARRRAPVRRRSSPMKAPRRRRSSTSGSSNKQTMGLIVGSMAYGALREKTSNLLVPVTSRLPLGSMADEITIATLAWYGQKKIKNPMAKNVLKSALIVESARIGEMLVNGLSPVSTTPQAGKIF